MTTGTDEPALTPPPNPAKPPKLRLSSDIAGEFLGWREQGACNGAPLNVFFAPDGHESTAAETRRVAAARRYCGGCPVRLRCLGWALKTNTKEGTYGGLTEEERAAYRRRIMNRGGTARLLREIGEAA